MKHRILSIKNNSHHLKTNPIWNHPLSIPYKLKRSQINHINLIIKKIIINLVEKP